MRLLYILATYLLFPLLLPVLCLHRKTRHGLKQRLGFYAPGDIPPRGDGPVLWLHGASAGDLLALAPMFAPLRARFPGCQLIVSTMTDSGHAMAKGRLAKDIDGVVYVPYDLWGATRRAVKALRPDLLVLEYTEVWPNLIRAAKRGHARVVMTNGRFSPANVGRYRWLFRLIGNPLKDFDLLLMREEGEAERALQLGAHADWVKVTGNTKFDALASGASSDDEVLRGALGLTAGERVWIAGSTHEGEEEVLFGVYRRLLSRWPDLRLVVAPRYVDRAPRITALAREVGLEVGLRSTGNGARTQVVVLDTIGELSRAYRLGTVVFVGGSFTKRGGQNILEPAGQGRPVLYGPHMDNFRDSVALLTGQGGWQVADADALHTRLEELLSDPVRLESLGAQARETVRRISGASERNADAMTTLFPHGRAEPR
ncbi:3-deoxy-D-manno-octulosonic acid transferase [Myxococcus sp. K15C18031901]|uniref:3-deoxy-D-manno-octulosonic acid transferase n=1 Tax=Myxococcus dinghuensis TaxID=2906761 RepID=UPI0020A7393C|nr:glycosyltransferase N-terminal domain-containing protein [Myxococcus dinghuensis]MCP3101393.1 3-deoxy-D-manno-octulosonic acid transferase [Myxococcus dinghuensis]